MQWFFVHIGGVGCNDFYKCFQYCESILFDLTQSCRMLYILAKSSAWCDFSIFTWTNTMIYTTYLSTDSEPKLVEDIEVEWKLLVGEEKVLGLLPCQLYFFFFLFLCKVACDIGNKKLWKVVPDKHEDWSWHPRLH